MYVCMYDIRYPVEGYLPFVELACPSVPVELPPPQVSQKNNNDDDHYRCRPTGCSDKSDDIEYLTSAMKRMSVHTDDGNGSSHLIEKGNQEPSLRPARVQSNHHRHHSHHRHSYQSSRSSLIRPTTILSNRPAERDDYSISPSLYFEMTIVNRTTIYKKRRQSLQELEQRPQLGGNNINNNGNNGNNTNEKEYTVGEDDEESQENEISEEPEEDTVIVVGMQSLDNRNHVRLEYHCMNRMATLYQGRTARTEPFALEIADGDVIGLLYVQEAHSISITVNGKIISKFSIYL